MQLPSERLERKVEKENLWLFVLSVLSRGRMNGAGIKAAVTKRFGFVTGNMTVYKVLYLLETGGYVRSKREGRSVVYEITDSGRGEMKKAASFLTLTARELTRKRA